MKSESWTDIVFEKRNKAYGAYILRKASNNVLLFALTISVFAFITVWGSIFLFAAFEEINYDTQYVTYDMSEIPIIDNPNLPDYLKSPPPSRPEDKPKQNTAPVVTSDSTLEDTLTKQTLENDSTLAETNSNMSGTGTDTSGLGNGFSVIEKFPSFPGGEIARKKFIKENIKLSQGFIDAKMKGTVYISFIVEPDGSVTNIKVVSGIGLGCDEEAVRVAKLMPKWIPGTRKGEPIRVVLKMPITFAL